MCQRPPVVVAAEDPHASARAEKLAVELDLSFCGSVKPPQDRLVLAVSECRLELREPGRKGAGAISADFEPGTAAFRRARQGVAKQLLARAIGLGQGRTKTVLDATAGLGQDAFVLAAWGLSVRLLERSTVVAALLRDGLERARSNPRTEEIVARTSLTVADARDVLRDLDRDAAPDVVYLDPMYPLSGKSAAKRKELRLLRLLLGDDDDAPELFAAARQRARRRVVVKRARHAPPIATSPPDLTFTGTTVRYDIYLQT